jgi:L-threonylcarbamoyladenylate synthase
VDSGETPIGIESTVLDLSGLRPTILRPGGVTREQLMMILDNVEVQNLTGSGGFQKSPGQLMKHYSPHAEMVYLVDPLRKRALRFLRHIAEKEISNGRSVGLLIVDEDLPIFSGLPVQIASLGPESDLWGVAHRLYEGMRALNSRNVEIIFARDLGNRGPGLALRDRLRRAATKVIWQNKEIDTNLC